MLGRRNGVISATKRNVDARRDRNVVWFGCQPTPLLLFQKKLLEKKKIFDAMVSEGRGESPKERCNVRVDQILGRLKRCKCDTLTEKGDGRVDSSADRAFSGWLGTDGRVGVSSGNHVNVKGAVRSGSSRSGGRDGWSGGSWDTRRQNGNGGSSYLGEELGGGGSLTLGRSLGLRTAEVAGGRSERILGEIRLRHSESVDRGVVDRNSVLTLINNNFNNTTRHERSECRNAEQLK